MLSLPLLLAAALIIPREPPLSRGFQHFYNLRCEEAIAEFTRETQEQPTDPRVFNHLAQAILYRDMYRAGALESELVTGANPFLRRPKVEASPEDQRMFDSAIARAIQLAQARLKENPADTEALYTLGVSYGLRANYDFLVRKAWKDALRNATNARKYHERVLRLDPGQIDAMLVPAVHNYVVGSLPWHWRVLGFLAGIRGGKEEGIRGLELVAQKGVGNSIDAKILLCAVYRRERQPQKAIPLLQEMIRRFPQNYLFQMELAQMYSDLGDLEKALAPLRRLKQLKLRNPGAFPTLKLEKILFAEGNIQFWYNDLDAALANMKKAAASADDLDLNTGVLAWMRLGQIYDLKGQRALAVEAYRRAAAFAPESDAAKESRGYLSSPFRRKKTN
ncbi:MAG TPA: tetratricopeptide repeat protein [Bryobacteraceae bacterium]|nr:tetratricopeptide repeat protein [Bryobacteraceae bacterium]HOL73109.1 tetratricopeptide repeat protein [Bryobacteraceae bacterium]HOQ47011.1 tetratricopeptide repeat protein [Bryobacteraceae bacterium]HPQ15818.1 tetratricopeptide repeat protein [Bryobacteraceae bacterium]HPU73062.1 tetratricopeptide repeat protein [Bryobacteraceae bacterium]